MAETFSGIDAESVLEYLGKRDGVMKSLASALGPPKLEPGGDYFNSIVESMIYQQVTGSAADAIYSRFLAAAGGKITPENVASMSDNSMRSAGLSRQKTAYIRDLTDRITSGRLILEGLEQKSDEDVIRMLTEVKGIGTWTAQMFLIFTLGRINILPLNDLGIRRAISKRYGVKRKLTDSRIERIADKWKPYRTMGVLLLWESENMKLPQQDSPQKE